MSYPHVVPLLKLCSVPATRAAVEKAFNSRACPANVEVRCPDAASGSRRGPHVPPPLLSHPPLQLLERIVHLRRQESHLLGYAHHAAFVLEERMAKTADAVATFLADLGRDLRPLADADLASLTALKHAEEGPASGDLTMADYRCGGGRAMGGGVEGGGGRIVGMRRELCGGWLAHVLRTRCEAACRHAHWSTTVDRDARAHSTHVDR
jgi:hypothetical protein